MVLTYPLENIHTRSVAEVLTLLQTDADSGISTPEAARRLGEFGPNAYQTQRQKPIWQMLLQQFLSPIVYLLVVGAAVSIYFQDYIEAVAIGVVIVLNALIGFFMELQSRNSMNALRKMDVILSTVVRDGKAQEIPAEQLVPGDVVVLEAGDIIPGDGRLVLCNQLQCNESSLTGESLPTHKNGDPLPQDTALGDRHNMVFKGTSVINGNGKAVITGTAEHTELGAITSLVAGAMETTTLLDQKLNALSKKLIWLTLILTAVFAVTGMIQGKTWVGIIKTSIALAIAAFPEGLPIVATVALSYGMLMMAKRNVIVKKLSAVETLGSTTVILTDKTGTLTENKIYTDTFSFPEEKHKVHIEDGKLHFDDGNLEKSVENFNKIKIIGALCNNAAVNVKSTQTGKHETTGDPIDIALLDLVNTSGSVAESIQAQYPRIAEIPFSSETKIMGTLHKGPEGYFVAAKGSLEQIIALCDYQLSGENRRKMTATDPKNALDEAESMAAQGLRVLAFAYRAAGDIGQDGFLCKLTYVGCIGFLDPPRSDIKPSILLCRNAGIRIVMVTGDHPLTALNIAYKTGLVDGGEQPVLAGKDLPDLKSLTDVWRKKILATSIFARTTPKQKLEIAGIFQQAGNIVAMTGDGVNDAPALKKADVGIAMGRRGTQVAKETASIVVTDDRFTSIVAAVADGRTIFKNIQKFVIYLVSCNLSEIFIVMALGFIAPSATLIPLQILFLNIVTDVFPALAIGLGRGDKSAMEQPPKDPKEAIITNRLWGHILLYTTIITLSVLAALLFCQRVITPDPRVGNNVAFIALAFAQLFHVFNMASSRSGLFINDITKNKFIWFALIFSAGSLVLMFQIPQIRYVLQLEVLPIKVWAIAVGAGLLPLLVVAGYKKTMALFDTVK